MYNLYNIKNIGSITIYNIIIYILNILIYIIDIIKKIIIYIKIHTIHEYVDYMLFTEDFYSITIKYCKTSLLIKIIFDLIKNYYSIGIEIFLNIYLFIIYTTFYNLTIQIYNHDVIKFYLSVSYMLLNITIFFIYTN